ncbi:VOC family protein [Pseudomonas sp. SWRI154]|uniref:VOC family protein n=1 Tax=Pseudomonas sp. SWRI154 TaxID=2745501 RepID=UPI001645D2DB|nr:VOC family protein [Pseudomonas sp. SWRI154]MBC3365817.1 VOC family protein [Pseudomonas sp. SWRI154]
MNELHLAIRTANPEGMISFYQEVFAFHVLEEFSANDDSFHLYFLSDSQRPKLELIFNRDPTPQEMGSTLSHYGFFVDDYNRVLSACQAAQLPILDEKLVNGLGQFYVQDPDGHYVEVNQV